MIAPITIGPGNAAQMTGVPWRWLRDHAGRLGVPIWRVGGKSMIPATPLLQALERLAAAQEPRELTEEEERQRLRRQLGMERIPQRSSVRRFAEATHGKAGNGTCPGFNGIASARIRVTSKVREAFALPNCPTDEAADERALLLADVARRMRHCGVDLDKARQALQMIAGASPRSLRHALASPES